MANQQLCLLEGTLQHTPCEQLKASVRWCWATTELQPILMLPEDICHLHHWEEVLHLQVFRNQIEEGYNLEVQSQEKGQAGFSGGRGQLLRRVRKAVGN